MPRSTSELTNNTSSKKVIVLWPWGQKVEKLQKVSPKILCDLNYRKQNLKLGLKAFIKIIRI